MRSCVSILGSPHRQWALAPFPKPSPGGGMLVQRWLPKPLSLLRSTP